MASPVNRELWEAILSMTLTVLRRQSTGVGRTHTYPATMTAVPWPLAGEEEGMEAAGGVAPWVPSHLSALSAPPALPPSFFLLLPLLSPHAVYGQSQGPTVTQFIRSRGIRTHSSPLTAYPLAPATIRRSTIEGFSGAEKTT